MIFHAEAGFFINKIVYFTEKNIVKTNESISRYATQMKDEDVIMKNEGYLKNYDCGNYEFIWKK